jgi:hypothetical protein
MAAGSGDSAAACIAEANTRTGLEWVTWITGLVVAIIAGIGAIAVAALMAFAKILAGFRDFRRQMQAGVNQVKADVTSFSTAGHRRQGDRQGHAVDVAGEGGGRGRPRARTTARTRRRRSRSATRATSRRPDGPEN